MNGLNQVSPKKTQAHKNHKWMIHKEICNLTSETPKEFEGYHFVVISYNLCDYSRISTIMEIRGRLGNAE